MKDNLLRANYSEVSPEAIEDRYKKCKDTRLKERFLAILHSFEGLSPPKIAKIVRMSAKTVRTWIKRFNTGGIAGLKFRPIPGRPCRLSESQQQELKQKLIAGPRANGMRTNNWTCKRVRRLILQEFSINYSIAGVCALLHRLGFRIRRPWYSYRAANPEEQLQFLEELEQEIAELDSEWLVVAIDEATMRLHPTLRWCWALKGARVEIPTWGSHPKKHLYAAVGPQEGVLSYRTFDRLNSTNFCQFLTHLLTRWPDRKFYIIQDNARFHTSHQTRDFLEAHTERLKVKFLPKYSPQLNPAEQLFRWIRAVVTHNHFFETLRELFAEIHYFLARVRNSPKQLKQRCVLKA